MKIQESGENYLETILMLKNKNGTVRSIDIANKLEFTKASISRAVGILKNADYITVEKNGNIELTEKGELKAKQIYERHQMIADFLTTCLGVDKEIAEKDACRIEHVISEDSINGIRKYLNKK